MRYVNNFLFLSLSHEQILQIMLKWNFANSINTSKNDQHFSVAPNTVVPYVDYMTH